MEPTSNKRSSATKRIFSALGLLLLVVVPARGAETGNTGIIEGRVFDPARGMYVENARVTIAGTSQETFTDSAGQYRLSNVSVGTAKVNVFFTGLAFHTDVVTVATGQTLQHDVTMASIMKPPGEPGDASTVRLDEFVVTASREMSGAAIAINEQRFARNIRTVVAADEFGTVVDGTPGEILKFLPGIAMDNTGGEARAIQMGGMSQSYTPVTMNGFDFASAGGAATARTVILDNVSINNLARIEVVTSPTPESPANALAGSVNMVPRSAFERSRPLYTGTVFLAMKDNDKHLNKTAGPFFRREAKVTPGFNFNAIVPVNNRFGFTVSGNKSLQYSPEDNMTISRVGQNVASNGTTLPDTTPDKPYMNIFQFIDSGRRNEYASAGLTVDFKVTKYDILSVQFQYAYFHGQVRSQFQAYFIGGLAKDGFGPTFTHGLPGLGTVTQSVTATESHNYTVTPTFTYRHNGPIWKGEAGFGYSRSSAKNRMGDKGFFNTMGSRITGLTVAFDEIDYMRPQRITVTKVDGITPVDSFSAASYMIRNGVDNPYTRLDAKTSAYVNLRRDLAVLGVPLSIKGGLDARRQMRDANTSSKTLNFVGADGRAESGPDDNAMQIVDLEYSQRVPGYGFPKTQWPSVKRLYELYQAHPEYFSAVDQNAYYRSVVTGSKFAQELISSGFIRSDISFLDRRLQLVCGVRAEQTNVQAEGPRTDPTGNYQRDATGKVLLDSAGRPALILANTTGNALGISRLTFLNRQATAKKEYLRYYPSFNGSFALRENLIVRGAHYYSIGRPDFNQYSGGITLPDTTTTAGPTTGLISVSNVGIQPWTATSDKLRIEYYFGGVGQVSIGGFRRDFKNFFTSTTFHATPEFLALYNLDPVLYGDRYVSTQRNLDGHVVMNGIEFDYKQSLTFLPKWARGVQAFANATALRTGGPLATTFNGYVPRVFNWGLSLTRPKYKLNANWNYRGLQRLGTFSGQSIAPFTYDYASKRLTIDLAGEYQLSKHLWLQASIRNLNDNTTDWKAYNPATPKYARLRTRADYASNWSIGLKGSF